MTDLKFTENLVKGRIAETIFAQLLRVAGNFTVLEFGYEKVIPELIDRNFSLNDPVVNTLRVAPDFAIIDRDTHEVKLVEVKYRWKLEKEDTLKSANNMHTSWNPSYLFVATLDGFYFDDINTIIKNSGDITPFSHNNIPEHIQIQYLKILKDFENIRSKQNF